jgi:Fic family protein
VTTPTIADPLAALAHLPGVPEAVDRARTAVDRLRAHKVLRSRSAEVTAESALRGARASAALAGADWPLEELRRRSSLGEEDGAGLVRGALRISGELGALLPILRQAPAQALSRMHMLAAAGEVGPAALARPRTAVESVTAEPGGPQIVVPAEEAAARLAALTGVLGAPSTAPAVVVAAVAYGELLAATPFGWGDGLVGRGLFRLLLAARGLDPQSLAVPEVGFVELGLKARTEALAGYATGTAAGLGGWIEHCAEAVSRGALESTAICEAFMRG